LIVSVSLAKTDKNPAESEITFGVILFTTG
jgi:hypothetical protein